MSILTTPEEYINLKKWVKVEMKPDVYIEINTQQTEAFKMLIIEQYGWPIFTINFSRDMNRVMKCEL
jgi:hypothetical protein